MAVMAEIHPAYWGLHRLYSRIYLAVLGIVAVLMLSFATAWHLHTDPRGTGQILGGLATSVERELQHDLPAHRRQLALAAWSDRMNAGLTLYSPDGHVWSSAGTAAGAPVAPQALERNDTATGSFALTLSNGRRLVIKPRPAAQRVPGAKGTAMVFVVIALVVGLGCYPLVRGLTGRLERLQRGVDAWDDSQHFQPVRVGGRDEIAALAGSFNHAADRISGLLRAQKSLLANASHELRSPLARLRLAIELLPAPMPAGLSGELARNIAELDELVDEILLASRLDALGATVLRPGPVDVAALIRAEARGDTDMRIDGEPLVIEGDQRLVGRMLRNLLDNAHRHGGGTPVTASACRDGGGVRIEISDRGHGIVAHERERVFEPFYRAAGSSEHEGGVGLGLSLVKQIAQLHQGRVVCQPRDGGGSCFVVWLPGGNPSSAHGGIGTIRVS